MTLNQILRGIRRQPAEPDLTAEQRALVERWTKNLEGVDVDEVERRAVEGREEEIRQALAESRAYFEHHREERRRQSK